MIQLFLVATLLFFISSAIFYELDAGLKASHICIEKGETPECFEAMRRAK